MPQKNRHGSTRSRPCEASLPSISNINFPPFSHKNYRSHGFFVVRRTASFIVSCARNCTEWKNGWYDFWSRLERGTGRVSCFSYFPPHFPMSFCPAACHTFCLRSLPCFLLCAAGGTVLVVLFPKNPQSRPGKWYYFAWWLCFEVILFPQKSVENPVKHKGTCGNRPSQEN